MCGFLAKRGAITEIFCADAPLDAARRTELLEQIEIQLPDEFKAYYDAFNQVLAARTAANAR